MYNRNSVIIKTNAYGLILILDQDMPFDQLLQDVGEKFREAARFFRNAQMALTFQGRELSSEEERKLIFQITENSSIHIVCVVNQNKEEEAFYKDAVTEALSRDTDSNCWIHRGTIKKGQVLDINRSVLIMGDVNPGAKVISTGNIIVMGCVMGNLFAGANGNADCFAAALVMKPKEIRIADKRGASAITKLEDTGEYPFDPNIIYIKEDKLIQVAINHRSMSDIIKKETNE